MKRDHWTNEEVIKILEGFKKTKNQEEDLCPWNMALEIAAAQFYDFKREPDQFGAMAYDPSTQEIVVVGPPLPR